MLKFWYFSWTGVLLVGLIGGFVPTQTAVAQVEVGCAKPLILVGQYPICDLDIDYQLGVDFCYGDSSASREIAAAELVSKALEAEVIRLAYHQEPPPGVLLSKMIWMEKTTRDSAKLSCIKHCFVGEKGAIDTAHFYKLVVAPTLINPRLHAYFAVDTSAQRDPIQTIALFWKMVKADGKTFDKLKADTVHIAKAPAGGDAQNPLVEKVLQLLKPGQLWENVIEDDQSYRILKLISENSKEYVCKILTIEKKPFDPWFREYVAAHVPIVFNNQLLKISLTLKYPQLWWLHPQSGSDAK